MSIYRDLRNASAKGARLRVQTDFIVACMKDNLIPEQYVVKPPHIQATFTQEIASMKSLALKACSITLMQAHLQLLNQQLATIEDSIKEIQTRIPPDTEPTTRQNMLTATATVVDRETHFLHEKLTTRDGRLCMLHVLPKCDNLPNQTC